MFKLALGSAALLAVLAVPPTALAEPAPDCSPGVDLAQYRGKVVYVDFWASWCGPCQLSFPFMNRLQQDFAARGLAVVAVDVDARAKDARAFLARHPAQFNVVSGDNAGCAKRFRLQAMPTSYLVDRAGNVRAIHPGFHPEKTAAVRAEIERLLGEKTGA